MNKTNTNLNFRGTKLPILGQAITEGQKLPNFKLTGNDMADMDNSKFAGKTLVISVVPSLDTPTCATQTRRFNEESTKLSKDVAILTVSMDLPFAQARWCGAEGIKNVVTASDYKYRSFGESFGTYIQTMGLLARAVFVVDKGGIVRHVEYVQDLSAEPDYTAVIAKLKELK